MRKNIKQFAELVSKTLPVNSPIFEFGSFQVEEQVGFADLRSLYQNVEYIGCDMREGIGVDKILDLHSIDLQNESAGLVLCYDTLEHVEDPRLAMQEIHRILKPDGIVVITSVMNFPIHEYPHDYWRFTPEAFKSILKVFSDSFTGCQGSKLFPHTVVGIGFKGKKPNINLFTQEYIKWNKNDRYSLRQIVIKLTPPILLPIVAWIYGVFKKIGLINN